ncbi:SMI1/KNR4 family protein [Streptomyces radicis]|uniref:SMI1/KNR4 family protein n=1 Tax=Streptomyces radicis TaxID=1750517 RepID=UPI0015FF7591|nr:SMI1/KNR4 family protein [Streptomyces radicis]
MEIEEWRSFLTRWSGEWADAVEAVDRERGGRPGDAEARERRWLGFPAASDERTAALEARLGGVRLPPSYRSFLAVTDGWRHAGGFVRLLGVSDRVDWHGDPHGRGATWGDDAGFPADLWARSLQLAIESDLTDVLLDPADVGADGEWAAYVYAGWAASPPERFASFAEAMRDLYRRWHALRADEPGFVNGTTRALDAAVDEAARASLAGEVAEPLSVLRTAAGFGRRRARALLGEAEALLSRGGGGSWRGRRLGRGRGASFRAPAVPEVYRPPGPFGDAVAAARELARWGDTDGAWRVVAEALPAWRPREGAELLAPVGLLADPVLGPVITPERGRSILATPRGGAAAPVPSTPPPAAEPDGLAWLVDGGRRAPYRLVLVEGVPPGELAARVGEGPLLDPVDERELFRLRHGVSGWSSGPRPGLARVGTCGGGWSFAYESRPEPCHPGRRVAGPGSSASRGTRAVMVWSDAPGLFHVALAEDGRETGRFTLDDWDAEPSRAGTIPEGLDPGPFFPAGGRRREADYLASLAEESGVSLPRLALTAGRLPAVRVPTWLAPLPPDAPRISIGFLGADPAPRPRSRGWPGGG